MGAGSSVKTGGVDLSESQLFLDDYWVDESIRVQRVFHNPEKFPGAVLLPDKPWEKFACVAYGTVLYRENRFHLWYVTLSLDSPWKVCYAFSEDGINFVKPELGIYEFGGSKKNNICLMPDHPAGKIDNISVIEDDDDPEWPLKSIFWQNAPEREDWPEHPELYGLEAARSKDGIHWDRTPGRVLAGWYDRTNAFPEKVDGKFVILARPPRVSGDAYLEMFHDYHSVMVFRSESDDLVRWSDPKMVLKQDLRDDPELGMYSLQACRYESMYVGFIERMHFSPDVVDTELVYSRDSRDWHRTGPRSAFLGLGCEGSFDSCWVNLLSNCLIRYGHRLWFYYSGRVAAHGVKYPHNYGAIGLATMRSDGFASLRAREREGWFQTPVFRWDGSELAVNADPRRELRSHFRSGSGELRVEVRHADGKPVEGFSRGESVPITVNTDLNRELTLPGRPEFARVNWKSGNSTRSLAGRDIRLVFYLRDAHIYSFTGLR